MNGTGNMAVICAETVPAGYAPILDRPEVGRRRGLVYFATDGDLIKIGHSRYPERRVKELVSPTKAAMRLLAFYPGYMDEEHNVHRLFPDLVAHGDEWFRDDGRIAAFMGRLKKLSAHLYVRRISINDVILGKHIEILGLPGFVGVAIDNMQADTFGAWADKACGPWPNDLQVCAARSVMAMKGIPGHDVSELQKFKNLYRDWAAID